MVKETIGQGISLRTKGTWGAKRYIEGSQSNTTLEEIERKA